MKRSLLAFFCFCSLIALGQSPNSLEEKLRGRMGCGIVSADTVEKPRIMFRCGGTRLSENQPLIVLDGELLENGKLSAVDPNSIESITILKDAKAQTIYGCRATDGVIVITSKKVKDCKLIVLDEQDSLPMSRATVTIKNSWATVTMASNKAGEASMPTRLQGQPYKLSVTNVGYLPVEKELRFDSSRQSQVIYLKRSYKKLDSVIIVSYGTHTIRCGGCRVKCMRVHNAAPANKPKTEAAFSVYPNPVRAGAAITISASKEFIGFYQILSPGGQLLQSAKLNTQKAKTFQVAIGNWPAGVYFLRLINEETGKTLTQKFIVQ